MIGVGVIEDGIKQALGFAEIPTENAEVMEGLLVQMFRRGLR